MPEVLTITEESLELERQSAREALRRSKLPDLLREMAPGPYGCHRHHLDVLEGLETALAIMLESTSRLENTLADCHLDDHRFVALYALYLGAVAVREEVPRPADAEVRVTGGLAIERVLPMAEAPFARLQDLLVEDYMAWLSHYRNHADPGRRVDGPDPLLSCTHAYFELLGHRARSLGEDARHERSLRACKQRKVQVLRWRFDGFEQQADATEEARSDLLDVWPQDVVGNREFLEAGLRLARDVAGFEFVSRSNPKRINPVLFAMGDPGCGKTVTCHAIGNYFLRFCRERGVPARFVVIRRTDWASSYQNASAKQLVDIFKNQVAAFDGVVGVYWPDIDTAFAARDDSGLRSEEKNILGASFGVFDGTLIPKNGQWFMLCDANTLNMDRATVSRITQDPFHLRGPVTAADFVDLMRDKKLKAYGSFLALSEAEWLQAGGLCLEYHLSGRAVENVTRKVITEIEDFEYPDEYYRADLERRQAIIRECSRTVGAPRMFEILEHYRRFEQEAEERARRQKFEDRVREIVFNMSAQEAALKLEADPPRGSEEVPA